MDTNVLIAAFIARGQCSDLMEHCAREHVLNASEFILKEFSDKLIQQFKIVHADARAARALLESRMEIIKPAALCEPGCSDADDDWILATAVSATCDCMISGDKDLLALNEYAGIRIIRPSAFWRHELYRGSAN